MGGDGPPGLLVGVGRRLRAERLCGRRQAEVSGVEGVCRTDCRGALLDGAQDTVGRPAAVNGAVRGLQVLQGRPRAVQLRGGAALDNSHGGNHQGHRGLYLDDLV